MAGFEFGRVVSTVIAGVAIVSTADLEHCKVDALIGDPTHGGGEQCHALEPSKPDRVWRERVELLSLLRWVHLVRVRVRVRVRVKGWGQGSVVKGRARFKVISKGHWLGHSVHAAERFVVRVLECLVLHPRSLEAQAVGPDAHGAGVGMGWEWGWGCGGVAEGLRRGCGGVAERV